MNENYMKDPTEIDLRALGTLLWRNILKILLPAILVAAVVFAAMPRSASTAYAAKAQMIVKFDDMETAKNQPATCAAMLTSEAVLESAIQRLGADYTVSDLSSMVTAQNRSGTYIIDVSVSSSTDDAEQLLNAVMEAAKSKVPEAMDGVQLDRLGNITATESHSSRNVTKYAIVGFVAAALVIAAILVLKEFFNNTIKDPYTAAYYLSVPVIGVLPELSSDRKKKTCTLHFPAAALPEDYEEAVKAMRTEFLYHSEKNKAKTVVLTCPGAEEDLSNAVLHLAASLVKLEKKVLVIDCDLRNGSLSAFAHGKDTGLTDVLEEGKTLEQVKETVNGLDYICAGKPAADAPTALGSAAMKSFIQSSSENYDYVLLAVPMAALYTDASVLANLAGGVVLVVRSRFTKIPAARLAKRNVEAVGGKLLGTVVSRLDPRKLYDNDEYGYLFRKRAKTAR